MILYVHGFNMTEATKQRWMETTFKRLYWLGYKGRVGGFTWPCSVAGTLDVEAFDTSKRRAYDAATQLKLLLSNSDTSKPGLKELGYRVHILAHSQGNVVAGEALRQAGPGSAIAFTYIAAQGAIAAHCYDPAQPERADFTPSTPNVYQHYWRTGDYANFPEKWPVSDPSYLDPSYIQGSVGKFVNFYNPQDWALMGNGTSSTASDGSQT